MYIIKCDRCGKEKTLKNLVPFYKPEMPAPAETLTYRIVKMGEEIQTITLCKDCEIVKVGEEIQTITLCKDCEKEFDSWLNNYQLSNYR